MLWSFSVQNNVAFKPDLLSKSNPKTDFDTEDSEEKLGFESTESTSFSMPIETLPSNSFEEFLTYCAEYLDAKLHQTLSKLDLNRISKFQCPLEDLIHNRIFLIDHLNLIYWTCFNFDQVLIETNNESNQSDQSNGLMELSFFVDFQLECRIRLFITKFWSFINDCLALFKSSDKNENHIALLLLDQMPTSLKNSKISSAEILSILICSLKLFPIDDGERYWHNLKTYFVSFESRSNPIGSNLLIEALERIQQSILPCKIDPYEVAVISTIMLLKSIKPTMEFLSFKCNRNQSSTFCIACQDPLIRIERLLISSLETLESNRFISNMKNLDARKTSPIDNSKTALILFLASEFEYIFTLLNDLEIQCNFAEKKCI